MNRCIIEQTDKWTIESHGNGLAYSFYRKADMAECFMQGDDATQWRADCDAMQSAYMNPASVWHRKTWNQCLAQLCAEYVELGQ